LKQYTPSKHLEQLIASFFAKVKERDSDAVCQVQHEQTDVLLFVKSPKFRETSVFSVWDIYHDRKLTDNVAGFTLQVTFF